MWAGARGCILSIGAYPCFIIAQSYGAGALKCIICDVYTQDKWTAYNPCETAVFRGYFGVICM